MSGAFALGREARPFCYECFKPVLTCVCRMVPRLHNRTGVTVIQHPREQHHPLGTARFAELGLQHVRRLVDVERCLRGPMAPVAFPASTGLLYPSAGAIELASVVAQDRPSHLIVLDGTWHQARTMYRDMTWLHAFPHYGLTPLEPSRYRIRREPQPNFVSTLEALLHAIQVIEPTLVGAHELLRGFDGMIDQQIRCARDAILHHGQRRKRSVDNRRKPRALAERFRQVVVVYAETSANARGGRELIYFAAERLRSGETFERHVLPQSPLSRDEGGHHPDDQSPQLAQRRAVPLATFQRDWDTFAHPSDRFVAWSPAALRWLSSEQQNERGRCVSLKASYGSVRGGGGSLDDVVAFEQLQCAPAALPGRGGERLAHAKALAWLLHGC